MEKLIGLIITVAAFAVGYHLGNAKAKSQLAQATLSHTRGLERVAATGAAAEGVEAAKTIAR